MKKNINVKRILFCSIYTLISVVINCLGSLIAGKISFPLYLDSIMTMSVVALCGLIPGIICAAFTNITLQIFNNVNIFFMSCHVLTVLLSFLIFYKINKNENSEKISATSFMYAGIASALSNALLGSILSIILFGGNTPNPQVNNCVQGIYFVLEDIDIATYIGGIVTNLVDKTISALLNYFIYVGILRFNFILDRK